jgi:hypothetical protein
LNSAGTVALACRPCVLVKENYRKIMRLQAIVPRACCTTAS